MKIAFISDIHGNAVALASVLEDMKSKKVDKIYVLGDICYRGPEPRRSLDLIRSLNTDVIKGNADEWVVRGVNQGEVPDEALDLMNKERDWIVSQLEESDKDFLSSLPTEIHTEVEGVSIHGFHATPTSLFDIVLPHAEDDVIEKTLMSATNSEIYVYAHIHKPYIRYIKGKIVMNIGSVGLPFDGQAKSSYGLAEIHEGSIQTSIVRVNYDTEKVIQQYKDRDYPNAEMMSKVIKNGQL
ncbi:MAG: metallophosphoesterase family protein [Bacillus sp. (in: firmicutes)]